MMATPALLSVEAACAVEPLLNPGAIAAALLLRHGHVSPEAMVNAYNQAFVNLGGDRTTEHRMTERQVAKVTGFLPTGGVITPSETYTAGNVAVCAGGMSRALLKKAGLSVRLLKPNPLM
jgi:glycine/D-amino acid oxidase-like deaminating enzyme